jgi:NAD-dependent SIR2 family protein deacetylase
MNNTVFILGAGASKQAGVPLMAEFLDEADKLLKQGKVTEPDFNIVFNGIGKLQNVHSKSMIDLYNIESVFAAFEMARILKKFPGIEDTEINGLINSMRVLILKTIEQTLLLPVRNGSPEPPEPYGPFVKLLISLKLNAMPPQSISVLTFNYDLGLDYAFHYNNHPMTYGFEEQSGLGIPLLKLHGSLNWGKCPGCNEVIPLTLKEYFQKHRWRIINTYTKTVRLSIGSNISSFKHCGSQNFKPEPVIVPPTWNKTEYHSSLSKVWSQAAKELSLAENIIVIGYSLPPTDPFFRYLFALGTVGERPLKRFWVFDPDDSGQVEMRFKSLLGPGAESRFKYYKMTFEESLEIISNEFPKESQLSIF